MWNKPSNPIPIQAAQLVVGLYIWLDISWDDHPFLSNRFKIKTQKEIETIRALNVEKLYYFAEKSDAKPAVLVEIPAGVKQGIEVEELNKIKVELEVEKKEKQSHYTQTKRARDEKERAEG